MYGAFMGVFKQLEENIGEPYTAFPAGLMIYGAGGVWGWASLCGAANGGAAIIQLVSDDPIPLINELYAWYEQAALPNWEPEEPKFEDLPTSVSGSVLCHASVTNWCKESGYDSSSEERAERCAWLAGSVAKKCAELLNAQADGVFTPEYGVAAGISENNCLGCHTETRGKMDCSSCHFPFDQQHP